MSSAVANPAAAPLEAPASRAPGARGVSVIIPAHNEAQALPATLDGLLAQTFAGPLRVIVAANGCTDDTVALARERQVAFAERGREYVVLDLKQGSKPGALNAGDAEAGENDVRVYLDADIMLSTNAIEAVAAALDEPGIHLAAPRVRVARPKSWVTRSYADVWQRMPYVRSSVLGAGFYAVSAEGRRRWGEFLNIVADDKFVQLHFKPDERKVAHDAEFVVHMPEGFRELAHIRGRWSRGTWELRERLPDLGRHDTGRLQNAFGPIVRDPRLWPKIAVFLSVFAAGYWSAKRKAKLGTQLWERSSTARENRDASETDAAQGSVDAKPLLEDAKLA